MKKTIKLFAVVLSLAIAMCIGVLAAGCNGDKEATEFTITVLYPDGKPVDGTKDGDPDKYVGGQIKIQFCDADNADNCYRPLNLGADGKLVQSISEIKSSEAFANVNNFSVHIQGLPEKYTYADDIVLNSKNASVTITLQEK